MIIMKIFEGKDGVFKNPEDAITYMKASGFQKEVSVYDINTKKAYHKMREIYKVIKEYNLNKPLADQILPTNPFSYRGIVGCLGVQAYSICLGTYAKNHECVALFTGYNQDVLDTSTEMAHVSPGLKAMSSLAMLSSYWKRSKIKNEN